jgi:serine/threonine-protein kinase
MVVGAGIWYMFSGTYQTVPNIAGQTLEEASASLTQLSFDFNPIDEFSEEIPVGVVIRTDPEIGKRARVGNPISVFVSKGPERYVIPAEIVGKSPREAEQILKDLNLVVSGTEEIYDDVIEAGKVAATNPAPGASLKRDTPVIIQISKGPEPVEIPAVIGSLLSDVLPMLTNLGFTVVVSEQVFDEVLAIGAVVAIEPEQGSVVPKGSELKVKVSKGPSLISVPNVVGKSVNEATAILQAAGFAVVRENLLPGGAPLNLVYSQSPAANSKVAIGSTIIIKIV